jgi:RNA polymerase sigma-70 factor, ECF subfamily
MDEAQLIAAARTGDQGAFAALYQQHHQYVRAIGRSILRADDLDDLCQETFLCAFTRLESFEGSSQFRTWLSRIALNRCLLLVRSQRRAVKMESRAVSVDENPEHPGLQRIDLHLEGIPDRLELERLLRRLTPAQREALELACLEDMPAADIAAELNITVTAVKGRLAIARKKLRMIRRR